MSAWQSGFVASNGISLHIHRTGGDKPPVVLAHGITDNGLCWTRVARALEADYDLILVDARGHGLSGKPASGYSREEHAADLAGLIAALELGRPAVIGHSMGAGTASQLAAAYADRVGCLVLEDPPWRQPEDIQPLHAEEWRQTIERRRQLSLQELIAVTGPQDHPTWPAEEYPAWAESKLQVSPNVVGYITAGSAPWQKVAANIRCPALLVTADVALGAIVSPETVRQVQAANPHIRNARIPNAGHNIRRENFDAYLDAVRSFLAEAYQRYESL